MNLKCHDCDRASFGSEEALTDHALAVHSHSEIRMAVAKALRQLHKGPPRVWTYVREIADDWVVFENEDTEEMYRMEFKFSGGTVTFTSEPVRVVERVVYETIGT